MSYSAFAVPVPRAYRGQASQVLKLPSRFMTGFVCLKILEFELVVAAKVGVCVPNIGAAVLGALPDYDCNDFDTVSPVRLR